MGSRFYPVNRRIRQTGQVFENLIVMLLRAKFLYFRNDPIPKATWKVSFNECECFDNGSYEEHEEWVTKEVQDYKTALNFTKYDCNYEITIDGKKYYSHTKPIFTPQFAVEPPKAEVALADLGTSAVADISQEFTSPILPWTSKVAGAGAGVSKKDVISSMIVSEYKRIKTAATDDNIKKAQDQLSVFPTKILEMVKKAKVKIVIMGKNQSPKTFGMPYNDRGLGPLTEPVNKKWKLVSDVLYIGEELLEKPAPGYGSYRGIVHEFGHAIDAVLTVKPPDTLTRNCFLEMKKELKRTLGQDNPVINIGGKKIALEGKHQALLPQTMTDSLEYFAEAVVAYFNKSEAPGGDKRSVWDKNLFNTNLQAKDKVMFDWLYKLFGHW